MIINGESLIGVTTAFRLDFEAGLELADPDFMAFTMEVPSGTAQNQYGWLAGTPGIRKWVGERVFNNLTQKQYIVRNEDWEESIEVPRNDIADDQYGQWSAAFKMLGMDAKLHPGELIYEFINNGETLEGFDGVPFFATNHPMGSSTYSNLIAGAQPPWYLLDASKPVKPMGFQMREDYAFRSYINPNDPAVWLHKMYQFGADARYNAFYGLPQLALKSKATLTEATLDDAMTQMGLYKNEHGKALRVHPTILLVGPQNRLEAQKLIKAINNDAGATNVNKDIMKVIVSNHLAA